MCDQDALVLPPLIALAIRLRPGVWEYVGVDVNDFHVEEMTVKEYLHFKEELVAEEYGSFLFLVTSQS